MNSQVIERVRRETIAMMRFVAKAKRVSKAMRTLSMHARCAGYMIGDWASTLDRIRGGMEEADDA
jgi:hypothetical protein